MLRPRRPARDKPGAHRWTTRIPRAQSTDPSPSSAGEAARFLDKPGRRGPANPHGLHGDAQSSREVPARCVRSFEQRLRYGRGQMARLSRLDVAAKAVVEATYVDRLMDLGLITPEGNAFSSGDVLRAGWIRSLERSGLSVDDMAAAVRDGTLSFRYLDASAFDRFGSLTTTTVRQLSVDKRLPMPLLSVIREALGLPEPDRSEERRVGKEGRS